MAVTIQFTPIGTPISIYSVVHHAPAHFTAFIDYETYNYRPDYDYANLGFGYYIADSPDSAVPLGYRGHRGGDIQKGYGSPLFSITNGTVTQVLNDYYNTLVIVDDTYSYTYLHNATVNVSVGQSVTTDTIVATEGSTGANGVVHCHLMMIELATGKVVDVLNRVAGVTEPPQPPIIRKKNDNWILFEI